MADTYLLEAARNIAIDWVDELGKAYKRNGSSEWKPLPTWSQFCEAVLAIYAVLTPLDALDPAMQLKRFHEARS